MGNWQTAQMPQYYSFIQIRNIVTQINGLFQQNYQYVKILIYLIPSTLSYVSDWKQSLILGTIRRFTTGKQKSENVSVTVEDVYQMYQSLRYLKRKKIFCLKNSQQKYNTLSGISHNNNILATQCSLCLDRLCNRALPCLHTYCHQCVNLYIIKNKDKKCPQCRKVFQGSPDKLSKDIYLIIEDSDEAYEGIRWIILEILGKNNYSLVNRIKQQYCKISV